VRDMAATATTTTNEQRWMAYLVAQYLFQALVRSLDTEQRERVSAEFGESDCECQGFWPSPVTIYGIPFDPRVEDLDDLETDEYARLESAAQAEAARILLELREDRLKARAAELFNEAGRR
jgi:hypothetical protein